MVREIINRNYEQLQGPVWHLELRGSQLCISLAIIFETDLKRQLFCVAGEFRLAVRSLHLWEQLHELREIELHPEEKP